MYRAYDLLCIMPNTHGRRDATVELSRVGGVNWALCSNINNNCLKQVLQDTVRRHWLQAKTKC